MEKIDINTLFQSNVLSNVTKELIKALKSVMNEREATQQAHWLLEHHTSFKSHEHLINNNSSLLDEQLDAIKSSTNRLLQDEPIQHIIGRVDFFGCAIQVNKNVLIPRPETEELVYHLAQLDYSPKKIWDIGTGSGCIAIALKKIYPDAEVFATDISEEALKIANKNADENKLEIEFIHHNILESPFSESAFDLIVSNPPYVPESDLSSLDNRVKNFEPHQALFSPTNDPLVFYKKIKEALDTHLLRKGLAWLELFAPNAIQTDAIFKGEIYETEIIKDLQKRDRILKVKKWY